MENNSTDLLLEFQRLGKMFKEGNWSRPVLRRRGTAATGTLAHSPYALFCLYLYLHVICVCAYVCMYIHT